MIHSNVVIYSKETGYAVMANHIVCISCAGTQVNARVDDERIIPLSVCATSEEASSLLQTIVKKICDAETSHCLLVDVSELYEEILEKQNDASSKKVVIDGSLDLA